MKTNPLSKGIVTENFVGIGTVTDKMVTARAIELAAINGRSEREMSNADWEQAKRELTGGPEMDPKEALLEAAPESERWDPIPGSPGHQVKAIPNEDEDEEGRSLGEQLVEEGVKEAEHDQMLQAAREAEKTEQGEP